LIEVNDAIARNIQPCHFKAFALFQVFHRIQHRMMLRFVRDDVFAV
jgi:hypothetical protein